MYIRTQLNICTYICVVVCVYIYIHIYIGITDMSVKLCIYDFCYMSVCQCSLQIMYICVCVYMIGILSTLEERLLRGTKIRKKNCVPVHLFVDVTHCYFSYMLVCQCSLHIVTIGKSYRLCTK